MVSISNTMNFKNWYIKKKRAIRMIVMKKKENVYSFKF